MAQVFYCDDCGEMVKEPQRDLKIRRLLDWTNQEPVDIDAEICPACANFFKLLTTVYRNHPQEMREWLAEKLEEGSE